MNRFPFMHRTLPICLLFAFMSPASRADESDSDPRISEALKITSEVAKRYAFSVTDPQPRQLEFHPNPILRWSNPVAGEVHGNVFVWTDDGRPEVVASIFQWFSPMTHGSHEFQSLSTHPIEGSRDSQGVWISKQAGIDLRPVPESPAVADVPALRLRQVRAISRRFEVRKTDRDDSSRELRLLAQPIFRYGSDDSDVLDGSLFVFVQGTDPEVFLMIEARKAGDAWRWHYGLARMNSVKFVAKHQGEEVWRTEILAWGKVKDGQGTYTSFGPFERKSL